MPAASLEDWFQIHTLFVRYATALDHGEVETVVECFIAEGSIYSPVLGRFEGACGIRDFAGRTARARDDGVQFRHVISNLRADVDGDEARARCYLLDWVTCDGRTELLSPGEYECSLRKVDGRWLFVHRDVVMDRTFAIAGMDKPA
jgi:hypothetical protein